MTEPTRDEVRAMFGYEADKAEAMSLMYDTEHADVMRWRAAAFRRALALLDAGRKDRERLDTLRRKYRESGAADIDRDCIRFSVCVGGSVTRQVWTEWADDTDAGVFAMFDKSIDQARGA